MSELRKTFGDTKFVKHFYPTDDQLSLNIAFEPFALLNSTKLLSYLSTHDYLSKEQSNFIDYMFGDGAIPPVNDDAEAFLKQDTWNLLEHNGVASMKISETGKEGEPKSMYWTTLSFTKTPPIAKHYNFFYHTTEGFYALSYKAFNNQIRSNCFDHETKKIDFSLLEKLHEELNSDKYDLVGVDILNAVSFKSSKVSISKVLTSILPEIETRKLNEIIDFIKSEMFASKSSLEVSKNIFEVRGDAITYFYNVKNYLYPTDGTLGNSCMRGDESTESIKFYASNPSNVAMLGYIEEKKLLARSILWTSITGEKYTDRIYCSSSKYGTLLAAYCKKAGYKTTHSSTASDYGIVHDEKCAVKLDNINMKSYPFFDTMRYIDIIGPHLATTDLFLKTELTRRQLDFIIKPNTGNHIYRGRSDSFSFNKNTGTEKYLRDFYGKELRSDLNAYALITKPVIGIVNKEKVLVYNSFEKTALSWGIKILINKYNCLRPTLVLHKSNGLIIELYDKQKTVYSTYHKMRILLKESVFIPALKTYVIKGLENSIEVRNSVLLKKLHKLYCKKIVRITKEGLEEINSQIQLLPFKVTLRDLRPSRVYCINPKYIYPEGVKIKGIIIPFKHLRFVKK